MWSVKKPSKSGYFWVESVGQLSGLPYFHPVRVYSSKRDGIIDTVFSDGENFAIDSDQFIKWYSEEIVLPEPTNDIMYGIGTAGNFTLKGFATGSYSCKCFCGVEFIGDKRSVQCLSCAIKSC